VTAGVVGVISPGADGKFGTEADIDDRP